MRQAPQLPAAAASEARLALTLPARVEALAQLRAVVRGFAAAAGCRDETTSALALAANEAATNTLLHAYGPGGGLLHLTVRRDRDGVALSVRDEGRGEQAPPRGPEEGGRGLALVEALADEVELRRDASGAELRVRFRDP